MTLISFVVIFMAVLVLILIAYGNKQEEIFQPMQI
jgi:hypothetical protein